MTAGFAEFLAAALADGWLVAVTTAVCQATLARMRFRHRIDVIRAEAVTAVQDGVVPLTCQLTRWLAELEAAARGNRRDVELAAAFLAGPAASDIRAQAWPGLGPAGRDFLAALAARASAAASTFLTWSRPAAVLWHAASTPAGPWL